MLLENVSYTIQGVSIIKPTRMVVSIPSYDVHPLLIALSQSNATLPYSCDKDQTSLVFPAMHAGTQFPINNGKRQIAECVLYSKFSCNAFAMCTPTGNA